ncbi:MULTISPECIES: hypothetical protein [unclassified Pedobacter]|uniref:hypothetical protein n=1 Tax=unclassified Pedobacter TaxID=2628915 RepID=UPI001E3C27DF|nr:MULTISPECIES: hypothetical protein [unclassified Pedobacter]
MKKIQLLQGYGDMNSYALAQEYKKFANVSEIKLNKIVDAFSSPRTWHSGKRKFIDDIETQIGDAHNS